jgi:glycosyltransferase involved in cell wall biosynthesis
MTLMHVLDYAKPKAAATQMKTLHVISDLNPRSGGPNSVVRALSDYQARARIDVTVCTSNWKNSTNKNISEYLGSRKNDVSFKIFPSWSPLLISTTMNKWFRNNIKSFDIVHIHGLYRFPVTSAACWARIAEVPYLICPHGSLDPFLYKQSRYNILLKRIYERLFDIPNLNHAAAVHYTAEDEAKRAAFLKLRSMPVVVSNGIDWESYNHLPAKGKFRQHLGIDAKRPLVLFLGRINFKKGLDILVSAFSRVLLKNTNARLAIVGPDNEDYGLKVRQWCREQGIHDKVFFVDHLEAENVKEAYVDADVFVLPSYTENFGMTVVEAMACGTPVVISDQVNIWREIQETGAGVVVCLDPCAVADAICMVLEDKQTAEAMETRGRVAAKNCYAWPHVVDQMTQVYQELIANSPRVKS